MHWRQMGKVIGCISILGLAAVGFFPVSEECHLANCRSLVDEEGKYQVIYNEKPLLITLADKVFKTDLPIKYRVYAREYSVDSPAEQDS